MVGTHSQERERLRSFLGSTSKTTRGAANIILVKEHLLQCLYLCNPRPLKPKCILQPRLPHHLLKFRHLCLFNLPSYLYKVNLFNCLHSCQDLSQWLIRPFRDLRRLPLLSTCKLVLHVCSHNMIQWLK